MSYGPLEVMIQYVGWQAVQCLLKKQLDVRKAIGYKVILQIIFKAADRWFDTIPQHPSATIPDVHQSSLPTVIGHHSR